MTENINEKKIYDIDFKIKNIEKILTSYGDAIVTSKMENVVNSWVLHKILAYLVTTDKGFRIFMEVSLQEMEKELQSWAKNNKLGTAANSTLLKLISLTKDKTLQYIKDIDEKNLVKKADEDAKEKFKQSQEGY